MIAGILNNCRSGRSATDELASIIVRECISKLVNHPVRSERRRSPDISWIASTVSYESCYYLRSICVEPTPGILVETFSILEQNRLKQHSHIGSGSGAQKLSLKKLLKRGVHTGMCQNPQPILTDLMADIMPRIEANHLCLEVEIQERHHSLSTI
jgi:hypothetical protein